MLQRIVRGATVEIVDEKEDRFGKRGIVWTVKTELDSYLVKFPDDEMLSYGSIQLRVVSMPREDRPSELLKHDEIDPQNKAMALVNAIFYDGSLKASDIYIVWFANTLKNWKALVSTNIRNDRYYEVTRNGDNGEIYVDEYVKLSNVVYDERIGRYNQVSLHQVL